MSAHPDSRARMAVRFAGAGLGLALMVPGAASQNAAAKEHPPAAAQEAAPAVAPAVAPAGAPAAAAGAATQAARAAAEKAARKQAESVQATSLLGEPLGIPPMPAGALARAQQALERAQQSYGERPHDVDTILWLGRRFAGVGKFKEAVALFTVGLQQHPDDAHLLRFRGHRYITLRQFDKAVADLSRAADLVQGQPDEDEPPATPNMAGVVLDTFHENIHYHLALAHYLRGEWEAALAEWQATGRCVKNDDGRAMVAHWTWLTLQKLGRADEAAAAIASITPEMDIADYHAYHDAVLVYRGLKDPDEVLASMAPVGDTAVDFATLGYGVAQWHFSQGHRERGAELLKQVAGAEMWAAFGRIAAEADLARAAQAQVSDPAEPIAPAAPAAPTEPVAPVAPGPR